MKESQGKAEAIRQATDKKRETQKLTYPKYLTVRKTVISFRPRIHPKFQHLFSVDRNGFVSPPYILGKPSDPETHIIQVYKSTAQSILNTMFPLGEDYGTLNWLFSNYLKSVPFCKLKSDTQRDYSFKLNKLLSFQLVIGRRRACAGNIKIVKLQDITLLRTLYDKVLESYKLSGMDGRSTVNGQFRCLSSMISYGLQYQKDFDLQFNPCNLIKKESENKRNRYVTDKEYWQQLDYACGMGYSYLPIFFEHAYLLASRSIEVYNLTLSNITDEGYIVERTKGSKTNLILWSPRLKRAYKAAIRLRKKRIEKHHGKQVGEHFADSPGENFFVGDYLLTSRNGRISREGLKSVMSRLKKSMIQSGLGSVYWTLHDLNLKIG